MATVTPTPPSHHPLTVASPADAATAFGGAWAAAPHMDLPAMSHSDARMPMWEGLAVEAVFDLNDPATRSALDAGTVRVRYSTDYGTRHVVHPVQHTAAYGPWDAHRAAGVADTVKSILVDLFASFDFPDPYRKVVWVQGHHHAEPACAWPDCITYLTPAQMDALPHAGER